MSVQYVVDSVGEVSRNIPTFINSMRADRDDGRLYKFTYESY